LVKECDLNSVKPVEKAKGKKDYPALFIQASEEAESYLKMANEVFDQYQHKDKEIIYCEGKN